MNGNQPTEPAQNRLAEPAAAPQARTTKRRKNLLVGWVLHVMVWGYVLLLVAGWILIRREGERWWFATLMLFGPRWIFAAPLVVLLPVVALLRRRLLWGVAAAAAFAAFGIINVAVPWQTVLMPANPALHLRLLTCNTHRQFLDVQALSRAIADAHPDVVVLQEWTFGRDEATQIFRDPTWHLRIDRDMLIASKFPIPQTRDVLPPGSGLEGAVFGYDLLLPSGNIRLINLHLASPHLVFSAALHRQPDAPDEIADNCLERRIESQRIKEFLGSSSVPTLLAGDFNTPIDSETFRNAWTGFTDAFATAGWGIGVTYRVKWTRTRIDHILYNNRWQCRRCWLGPDVGSPHLPVIADLEYGGL